MEAPEVVSSGLRPHEENSRGLRRASPRLQFAFSRVSFSVRVWCVCVVWCVGGGLGVHMFFFERADVGMIRITLSAHTTHNESPPYPVVTH